MGKKKTRFQWERDAPEEEEAVAETPSRRDLKRDDNKYKALAKRLLALTDEERAELSLSAHIEDALSEVRRLKSKRGVRGGLRRQVQRVATLLRQEDYESIVGALSE